MKQVRQKSTVSFSIECSHLIHALAGMPYPAQGWQILSWAEYNGAGSHVMTELHELPAGSYNDLAQVIDALRRTPLTRRVQRGQ